MPEMEALQQKVDGLEQQLSQRLAGRVKPHRKLERFSGSDPKHTDDWIEDARAILAAIPAEDQINYLVSHLEGEARNEVRFAEAANKETTEKIFSLLGEQFGEKRTDAQLKSVLYERRQKDTETVRKYSRGLLELVSKLKDQTGKDKLLIEVFCENLKDVYVRREVKKKFREDGNIKFAALRDFAIQLAEDEVSTGPSACEADSKVQCVGNVVQGTAQSAEVGKDFKIMMESLIKSQEMLAQQHNELLKCLIGKPCGSGPKAAVSSSRKPICWHCQKVGHIKRDCYLLKSDTHASKGLGKTLQGNGEVPPSV